uniref:Lipocalin n=1 Tax=Rhipicephalus zambeziensis TaxID=60191 RepID=A0A224YN62_9ACAR
MNTPLPIWTYNTTDEHVYYVCKVDQRESITETSVYFNRTYQDTARTKVTTERLEGTFVTGNTSLMYVGDRGLVWEYAETLEFASDDYMCGVFEVRDIPSRVNWFDLRFQDNRGTGKPHNTCMEYFNKKQRPGHLIYWLDCETRK